MNEDLDCSNGKRHKENIIEKLYDSYSNDTANVVQKSLEILEALIKCNADPEKLKSATTSIEQDRPSEYDSETLAGYLGCEFSKSLEMALPWLVEREESRHSRGQSHRGVNTREIEIVELIDSVFDVDKASGNEPGKQENQGDAVITIDSSDKNADSIASIDAEKKTSKGHDVIIEGNEENASKADDDPRKKQFDCDVCGKRFSKKSHLTTHSKSHLENEEERLPFECDECGKRFPETWILHRHVKCHLDKDDRKKVECEICGKLLASSRTLKLHMETHLDEANPEQAELKRQFKCEECGRAFRNSSYLKVHMRIHSNDEEERRPLVCDECGKRFTQSAHLSYHKKRAHLDDDDPRKTVTCKICGKKLGSNHALKYHMQIHLDDADPEQAKIKRAFKCEQCGGAFRNATGLKVHMRTHIVDEKERAPYECDKCEKRFTQAAHLATHKNTHLAKDDPHKTKVECGICGQFLCSYPSLAYHTNRYHKDGKNPWKDERNRPFKCTKCRKTFKRKDHLKSHLKSHLDDNIPEEAIIRRTHKCDECDYKATDSKSLKSHMQIKHSGVNGDEVSHRSMEEENGADDSEASEDESDTDEEN